MKKIIFTRSNKNPILKPTKNKWENFKLYNPGVVYHNKKYHLFYRAVGKTINWQSVIGYAVSSDGVNFKRQKTPLLVPSNKFEKRGLEDPRITKIDNTFYMAYAAYDGITPRLSIATSKNLRSWKKHGSALKNFRFEKAGGVFISWKKGKPYIKPQTREWSKSGAIFPGKINNTYWMLFGEYRIWMATSKDGIKWKACQKPFLAPRRSNFFDNTYVEAGPPPIKTNKGWLVIYHGIDKNMFYRLGCLLLDLKNPNKIIFRSKNHIFGPKKKYELSGAVDIMPGGLNKLQTIKEQDLKNYLKQMEKTGNMPRVTFCCGAVLKNNKLHIYYGAGDSVICTATAKLGDILHD
ncbi:hypothetical protein KAJ89_00510 [Candidatus Parcubacteria bacterium]|nr:hypothetical protein [Candidatus Parcubacteria bacterium]